MAMIGSFLGWQPVLFVFFLAPITGVAVALGSFVFARSTILPYGPFLSAAAFGVICTWKWLWVPMRHSFGDATLLALLGGGAFIAFVALLGLIRRMQSISARRVDNDLR
jgi:leader peptidase (prepilin peptidase)/N-methyltransferase